MTPEAMLLAVFAAIVAALVAVFALVPRMVESRMKQADEKFKSQLEDAKTNRELTTLERGTPYKINELLTASLIRFADTGERTAIAMEKLVEDNKRTTLQLVEQSKIASLQFTEQGKETDIAISKNTAALARNTASMSSMDTGFQKDFGDFLLTGTMPMQKISGVIDGIVNTLELFKPYIYSIPANKEIIEKFRNIHTLTQQLVEQTATETIPPQDKEESVELASKIVSDMSKPPVIAAPDSLAAAPP